MKKALEESERAVDSSHASSVYGSNYTPQLASLIETVLHGVSDRVYTEFEQICGRYGVDAKLRRLEQLLEEARAQGVNEAVARAAAEQEELEQEGRKRGRGAQLQVARPSTTTTVQLPEGVTPADVLRFQAYDLKMRELEKLEKEVGSLEEFNRAAIRENEDIRRMIESKVRNIEAQRLALAKTAEGIF